MKNKLLITISMILLSISSFAQIEIDEIEKKKVEGTPFNGDFMVLPSVVKEDVGIGLIGESVTLIDVSTRSISNMDGSRVSSEDSDKFQNKTFLIKDYKEEIFPTLTLENESGVFSWRVTYGDVYLLNKYLDKIKERLLDRVYVPLHNKSEITTLDGSKTVIDGKEKYTVTKVSFSKFSIIDYGIKVELNNEISVKYPTGDYDQPTYHNGTRNVPNLGWINLSGERLDFTLIESDLFEPFSSKNSNFLNEIREGLVKVGMTKQQCKWSWGIPTKSYGSLVGYDEVYDWGGKTLYFKNSKLALIK